MSSATGVSAAWTVTLTAATVVPGRADRRDRPDAERQALVGDRPAALLCLRQIAVERRDGVMRG
jgi:hypothetical protein